ncbi:hypothetical protein LBMAG15_14350 [Actinomycetes bacterium]|nr:hypothetical protein LBMAG15_14350 [Actinomycetes bacterium]
MVTKFRLTRPKAMLRALARKTVPLESTTSEADGKTLSTRMTSSGTPARWSWRDTAARRGGLPTEVMRCPATP